MSAAKSKPAQNAFVVTTSDSVNLSYGDAGSVTTRALYVGGAGNISVEMVGNDGADQTVIFTGVLAGSILPIEVTRVNSTSTTATTIVALW